MNIIKFKEWDMILFFIFVIVTGENKDVRRYNVMMLCKCMQSMQQQQHQAAVVTIIYPTSLSDLTGLACFRIHLYPQVVLPPPPLIVTAGFTVLLACYSLLLAETHSQRETSQVVAACSRPPALC